MTSAMVGLVAFAAVGWADITLQPSKGDHTLAAWHQSIAGLDKPSERTAETLRRYDPEARYRRNPEIAIADLKKLGRKTTDSEIVYALAELSWIEGRRAETRKLIGHRGKNALDHYVESASYAWDYLFDPDLSASRNATDPRYRLACDLYNGSIDKVLRAAKAKDSRLQPGGSIRLKLASGDHVFRLVLEGRSAWKTEEVHELLLASDFEVTGLDSRSRTYGLGVPLIGVRRADQSDSERAKTLDKYYPPEMAFPLTAILTPNRRLRELAEGDEVRECTIDLYDPARVRTIGEGPTAIGLEADLTTPLAYMWTRTDLSRYRWNALFRPGPAGERAGLMLLRPYDPDKIPVVMVHGLASSPLAWIPMLNEMLRDPRIHDKYQFLLYVYPTGVPLPLAAAGLREALTDAESTFDVPGETPDREFRKMVLLGHSMGGLLSHAMVVDSGNSFWELSTDRPFDEINGPPEVLNDLKHYCFFKPLPFVKRVVFMGTPHRGSMIAKGFVGRVVSNQISEPDAYHKMIMTLIKDNPGTFNERKFRHMPTSIDTLKPDSPILMTLLELKADPSVAFHSIIGAIEPGALRDSSDGVVTYRSSHFEPVESEKVVRSGHGVQEVPSAILEVRRILMEHAATNLARKATDSGTVRPE